MQERFCIYCVVGGANTDYVRLLDLLAASIVMSQNRQFLGLIDFLVICDTVFFPLLSKVKDTIESAGSTFKVMLCDRCPDGVSASMQKVNIFNNPGIDQYAAILYLDCDIVVVGDIEHLFRDCARFDGDVLHVFPETFDMDTLDEVHQHLNYSLRRYSDSERAGLVEERTRPFNCGHFLFRPTDTMKRHFDCVKELILNKAATDEYFYEQSFMNHHFNLSRATDRGALLEKHVVLFAKSYTPGIAIHHSCANEVPYHVKLLVLKSILCDVTLRCLFSR